mgnify:CR=1 FL=1
MKRLITALGVMLLLISCTKRDNRISDRIAKNIRSEHENIDLAKVAPFPWDKVFIFGPYTPEAMIEKSIGHSWDDYKNSGIGYSEGFGLLLFEKDGKTIAWCMNPRNNGDFAYLYNSNGYKRTEAYFQVEYSGITKRANIKK